MNVYEVITQRIIDSLANGCVPWRKTWVSGAAKNLVSGKEYRGVNAIVLGLAPFSSCWWATWNQIKARGGCVRKGEKGSPVLFFSVLDNEQEVGRRKAIARYFTVFNVEQTEGIASPQAVAKGQVDPIERCEAIVMGYENGPSIDHWEPRAWYSPQTDTINVPRIDQFDRAESYYSTLFHEMGHSTGSAKRLARPGVTDPQRFGSHLYSKEELVAELSSQFLAAEAGITQSTIDNSAAYIGHWLKQIRNDPRLVIEAGAQAQKAADLVLGRMANRSAVESAGEAA